LSNKFIFLEIIKWCLIHIWYSLRLITSVSFVFFISLKIIIILEYQYNIFIYLLTTPIIINGEDTNSKINTANQSFAINALKHYRSSSNKHDQTTKNLIFQEIQNILAHSQKKKIHSFFQWQIIGYPKIKSIVKTFLLHICIPFIWVIFTEVLCSSS